MPRGARKEIIYTGKALKLHEKIMKMESDLKAAKEELKIVYKEQLKAEKAAAVKEKRAATAAAKKAMKENKARLLKAMEESEKSAEEILAFLSSES
ncbi:hypothetical protein AALB64_09825 [Lachnospiraceae bacterium 45-P1]